MKLYALVRKNKVVPHVLTWSDLQGIHLGGESKLYNNRYNVIFLKTKQRTANSYAYLLKCIKKIPKRDMQILNTGYL